MSTGTAHRVSTRRFPLHGSALAGLIILGVLMLLALLAPWLAPHDPEAVDATSILGTPTVEHPFGSDALGRDVFSRTMYALRVSLVVAITSVLLSALVAVPLGALAGYFGGWVDNVISRPLDMLLVLPALLLAVSLIAVIGPGSAVAALAIAIIYLPILARVMRASSLATSRMGYVEGASSRGSSSLKTIIGHVVPNSINPVIVQVTILAAFALQIEAALSFLGLGTQPPTPSLGLMLAEGREALVLAPWVEIFPGLVLMLTVMSFILIGDGLRAWLMPTGARR